MPSSPLRSFYWDERSLIINAFVCLKGNMKYFLSIYFSRPKLHISNSALIKF